MRVALIHPPAMASVSTLAQEAVPPIGLAYVAAALRRAGHDVSVIDAVGLGLEQQSLYPPISGAVLTGLSTDEILARIPLDTEVIGISSMFSNAWRPTRDLMGRIRSELTSAFIVLGGEHATACAHHILATCRSVDACVLGEGEATTVALLERLSRGGSVAGVAGLVTRQTARTAAGSDRPTRLPRIQQLDRLSRPAWDLFPLERYIALRFNHGVVRGRTMPLLASRGCPYRCTFCSSSRMWGTRWVAREPAEVVAEMKDYIARYRVNDFAFYDQTALIRRTWVVELCRLLIAEDLHVTWQLPSGTRSEILDAEVCGLLYRAGCRNLNFAPETGSPRLLERIGKRVNLARMLEAIRAASQAGLDVKVNIILGFPGETTSDFLDTCRFIARAAAAGAEAVSTFPFCPYPGTELFDELASSGEVRLDDDYFQGLVYTDLARAKSYNVGVSSRELQARVLLANAIFLAAQTGHHPRRVLQLATQLLIHGQRSKFANAVEPMRRRRAAFERLTRQKPT